MAIDWGFAWQIGGIGFGVVFLVLIILSLAIRLSGLIIGKIDSGKEEAGDNKKGA